MLHAYLAGGSRLATTAGWPMKENAQRAAGFRIADDGAIIVAVTGCFYTVELTAFSVLLDLRVIDLESCRV
jgi:hypothetical protein